MPANLLGLLNGDFEAGALHWETLSGFGDVLEAPGFFPQGSWGASVVALRSSFGPINEQGLLRHTTPLLVPEIGVVPKLWARQPSATEQDFELEFVRISDLVVEYVQSVVITPDDTWQDAELDRFVPLFPSETYRMRFRQPNRITDGVDTTYIDYVRLEYETLADLIMKSTVPDFMDKLTTVINAIDPNIGNVISRKKRWKTTKELKTDAQVILVPSSALDEDSRTGRRVLRFWLLEPRINPVGLTNASAEYQNTVVITGFYQYEDDGTQEEALRTAAIEIVDKLNTKTVELTDLNTGGGYLGFYDRRPRWLQEVQNARIGEGQNIIEGHTVQIEVTFFEEINY